MTTLKYKDIVTGDIVDLHGNNYSQMEREAPKELLQLVSQLQLQVMVLAKQLAELKTKAGEQQ